MTDENTISRSMKRYFRKSGMDHPVRNAYELGEALAYFGPKNMPKRLRSNPYPAGRRHDAWEYGRSPDRDHGE